ncbi:MAG: hypothetical protein JHC87_09285 [Thermoleophilaceae bacterium]|nr:hypothetical protein [Thermoleophilaceae bacterium]
MIEFFFFAGCPSHERALEMLRTEIEALGVTEEPTVVEVMNDDQATEHAFPGSPTIRVNGADIQDPGDEPAGLTCRIYRLRDGRASPLPDIEDLRAALLQLAND